MEGFVHEAMQSGALGMSTGLEFNPGREATADELMRLNAVAGEYDGIYTSHVRNRDSGLLEAIDEFLAVARAGGTRAEISHLNVRHNTNAPERGWERAVEKMAASRETGLDVLADTTPFREGLGQMAGILPPWVAEDGPEAAAAKLRDPALRERMRNESDRYWRFIHKGEWERVYFQATPQHPELGGLNFRADLGAARQGPVGLLPRHPRRRRRRLRGDPHGRDALHRRAPGGDDRPPALLPRRRHVHRRRTRGRCAEIMRHPLGFAGHVHYLTHHVREQGTLRLEEAIRKMTSMPAAHFGLWDRGLLRAGYSRRRRRASTTTSSTTSRRARVRPCTPAGSSTSSSTASSSSTAPSTPARGPAGTCCAGERAARSTSGPTSTRGPTEEMWEAMRVGQARLGDLRRGPVRQRAAGAMAGLLGKEARALGAHLRDGEPRRAPDDRATRKHRRPGGLVARPHLGGDGHRGDRRARARGRSGPRTGGSTRRRWRSRSWRPARRCSCSRTRTRGRAGRCSRRS